MLTTIRTALTRSAVSFPAPTSEGVTALGTLLLALFAVIQARITSDQLEEDHNEKRPWIAVGLIAKDTRFVLSPDGMRIGLRYTLTNTGHQPAFGVRIEEFAKPSSPHIPEEAKERRDEACQGSEPFGSTIFPGQTVEPLAIYDTAASWGKGKGPPDITDRMMTPWIMTCVIYSDVNGRPHHTPIMFDVRTIRNNQPGSFAVDLNPENFDRQKFDIAPVIDSYRLDPD